LHDSRTTGRITSSRAAALAAGLAILTEIVQNWVPNRDGSIGDLLADFLGILLVTAWYRRKDTDDERTHP
jgi:VanZ family protein